MAIAPVLKTGVRKDLGVRIPRPPFSFNSNDLANRNATDFFGGVVRSGKVLGRFPKLEAPEPLTRLAFLMLWVALASVPRGFSDALSIDACSPSSCEGRCGPSLP